MAKKSAASSIDQRRRVRERATQLAARLREREESAYKMATEFLGAQVAAEAVDSALEQQIAAIEWEADRQVQEARRAASEKRAALEHQMGDVVRHMLSAGHKVAEVGERLGLSVGEVRRLRLLEPAQTHESRSAEGTAALGTTASPGVGGPDSR